MEVIYIILLLVIIYLLVTNKNDYYEKIRQLEFRIQELHHLIKENINTHPKAEPPKPAPIPLTKPEPVEAIKPPLPKPVLPKDVEWHKEVITDSNAAIRRPVKTSNQPQAYKPLEPQPSFFERYPDLEKFIGENLVNKIGIAILVLAIGFFVKYAIDNNWIRPVGRVGIGVLCGGILIGIAHRMRNSYKAFSSVLVGGGVAILYFTITLAYHQFHLFSQTTSFVIMIFITGLAVGLSLYYDKQELAVIALIGGLSSPFMVSSGRANYEALFFYLVILNAGLLVIAYYKSWRILNISTFALTVIVFGGVLYTLTSNTYITGFIYATVLYLMFFAINVAHNVRENKKFIAMDFTILLTNTALYFAAGLWLLTAMYEEQFRGLFSAGLGMINLVLSYVLFRNKKVDINILYLLIGITLTFISLTAPIQLHGQNITLFWSAETVLLYWLYQRSGIKLMQLASILVFGAMLLSLLLDWTAIYSYSANALTIIANKGFITTLTSAISCYLLYRLIKKDTAPKIYGIRIDARIFRITSFILLFFSGLFEINHQFLNRYPDTSLNSIYLLLYVPAFVFIGYLALKRFAELQPDWKVVGIVMAASVAIYLLFSQAFYDAQYAMLVQHKASAMHFMAHWIGAVFMGLIFYRLILIAGNNLTGDLQTAASWILPAAIVIFLSVEVSLACNLLFSSPTYSMDSVQTVYIKVGLPILWGLSSFALMWLGMRNKARTLRIISLTLFSITLFKLFVFDIRNIPPAGKIAAFFCLGVLLLIISFMYQKVKKIIVDDTAGKSE